MKTFKNRIGNEIKIFAVTFENEAFEQIKEMSNFEPYLNQKIRIMPDSHYGKGCTVGTTMTIDDKITPNLTGVDLGCGVLVAKLKNKTIDLVKLDSVIREKVPFGFNTHEETVVNFDFDKLKCVRHIDIPRASKSIGSLGGGKLIATLYRNV